MSHTTPPSSPNGAAQLPHLADPRPRSEQLAAALERQIRDQGLHPGDPVGTLQSLRAETGYARSTVTEAVRLLRERGLVEVRPGRGGGLFVAQPTPVVKLRHTLLSVDEQPSTVADAIELREHLEELVDVGAARCRSAEDIRELRARLADMEVAEDWDGFMRANWALHARIAQICPNEMARAVYTGTLGHLSASASTRIDAGDADSTDASDSTDDAVGPSPADYAADDYRRQRHRVHTRLVDAIAAGDVDAVRDAVRAHRRSG